MQEHTAGDRVLLFYGVFDESSSMSGAPITAINQSLPPLHAEIVSNPDVSDLVRFSIIAFSDDASVVLPATDLSKINAIPGLTANGSTNYTRAFELLKHQIAADVTRLKADGFSVLRPVVFFMSDGQPTSQHWETALNALIDESFGARPHVIAFGIGAADENVIKQVGKFAAYVADNGVMPADALRRVREAIHAVNRLVVPLGRGRRSDVDTAAGPRGLSRGHARSRQRLGAATSVGTAAIDRIAAIPVEKGGIHVALTHRLTSLGRTGRLDRGSGNRRCTHVRRTARPASPTRRVSCRRRRRLHHTRNRRGRLRPHRREPATNGLVAYQRGSIGGGARSWRRHITRQRRSSGRSRRDCGHALRRAAFVTAVVVLLLCTRDRLVHLGRGRLCRTLSSRDSGRRGRRDVYGDRRFDAHRASLFVKRNLDDGRAQQNAARASARPRILCPPSGAFWRA